MKKDKKEKNGPNFIIKCFVVALFIAVVGVVINTAPNYADNEIKGRINLIINNSNVTLSLKNDMYVDNDTVYMSEKDIENFFDGDILYDEKYNQIITGSDMMIATLPLDKREITVNGSNVKLFGMATKKDDEIYLPFSELGNIYNVEVSYIKGNNVVVVDSLDREKKMANISKDCDIKYLPTVISRSLEKETKGNSVVIVPTEEDLKGWTKVRTLNGTIGYTKEIANEFTVRDNMKYEKQVEGKVSLAWDYYSEYAKIVARADKINGINVISPTVASLKEAGKGELLINKPEQGYVEWAHKNNYKVWALVSNGDGLIDTTSEVLNDYVLRENLINNIVNMASNCNFDGINIDFEYMYEKDKNVFSRFIIELAPRLREYGKVLSVDVTAPDGSENWSGCYDRHTIGRVADYIVYMAYDQYGTSSNNAGTTGGCDWVETNIKKFVGTQEEIEPEKVILAMPLYTRLWRSNSDGTYSSEVVLLKNVESKIPSGVEKKWDDSLKQNYVEFTQNGRTCKMWLEDEASIRARFELMHKYDLAGAAYWREGYEYSRYWDLVATLINN